MVWWKKEKSGVPPMEDREAENPPSMADDAPEEAAAHNLESSAEPDVEPTNENSPEDSEDLAEDEGTEDPNLAEDAQDPQAELKGAEKPVEDADALAENVEDAPAEPTDETSSDDVGTGPADADESGPADTAESGPADTAESEFADADESEPPVEDAASEPVEDASPAEPAADDAQDSPSESDQTADQATDSSPAPSDSFVSQTVSDTMVSPIVDSSVPLAPAAAKKPVLGTVLTIVGSVLGAILLVVGCGAVGTTYFDNHAKPGTELAGLDLTGFNTAQVRNVVATVIENYKATLELGGHRAQATSQSLGVVFDLDATVQGVMSAGSSTEIAARYNPFNAKQVPLVMAVDQNKLEAFLNSTFIAAQQRSVPAAVAYDADQGKFAVQPGKDGTKADAAQVARDLMAGEGIGSPLTVATTSEPPHITDSAAQQVADAANQYLTTAYTVTAGDASYTIPAGDIARWIQFTPDPDKGTIRTGIDAKQVTADLPQMLKENLTRPVTPQQVLVSPDGTALGVDQRGADGTTLADPAGVTDAVIQALTAGTGLSLAVDIVSDPYTTEQVPMAPEYLQPGGAKWVEINRSTFTVTRWEGTTQLSTWSVVIGRPSTPTYTGIFHVWYKVALQDMRGTDYLQPNVPWVAYFDGDNALHGNYWVGSFGWASSHGCVGMPVDLAHVMYDWIDIGTLVIVHD